jgi:hypothetical protein
VVSLEDVIRKRAQMRRSICWWSLGEKYPRQISDPTGLGQ